MKTAIHFTHANGIPAESYQKFLSGLAVEFDVKAIPMIGMDERYPITKDWRYLVDQVIDDIEQQFPQQKVVGLGHSFGSLVTLMAAYKRPDLFSQLLIMDPPFVIGRYAAIFELVKKLNLKTIHKFTPSGLTLKRKDHWSDKAQAFEALRNNRLFKDFDDQCFQDYFDSGIQPDLVRGGVTLRIPKLIEAEIFKTVPAWWWRTPRKAPQLPIHLITAEHSPFYKQGFPQAMQKIYKIEYSVLQGGHMFPLEQPEKTARWVMDHLNQQGNLKFAS
ncbi:alpha/beta hydrolase [Acinetobacter sp. ANC 5054]|uniref:alpha/beta fold hydrolase n=1 Tax=Acinetobacter sp. ANC 5054 TaxID=1977877 RepID=UPI000A34F733|nr:alpha/beta hydrolase [Acinetobacter sp. ANC 5054]OTG82746.1 alpha/beta hydrolase [Acinetobacter sp. ANC 5054]